MRGVQIINRRLRHLINVGEIAIGQVTKTDGTCKTVKVIQMKLDEKFNMYFNKSTSLFCRDDKAVSKNGDIVLIKKLEQQKNIFQNYAIEEVVHKLGERVDPFANNSYLNTFKNDSKNNTLSDNSPK
jgi:hypothetical protein